MKKEVFINERTRIISEMLDNPDTYGIYPTTKCFNELDDLFDKITSDNSDYAKCIDEFMNMPGQLKLDPIEIIEIIKRHFA